MGYWLMAYLLDVNEKGWHLGSSWTTYIPDFDRRVIESDIVFIANENDGIFAWGVLLEIGSLNPDGTRMINIGRGAISQSLVTVEQIKQSDDLSKLLSFSDGRFGFLANRQVEQIIALMPIPKPPVPRHRQYILNGQVDKDEGLQVEYKLIKPSQIPKQAYDNAVAFLNKKGGSLVVGIRDNDNCVIGLLLNNSERDQIKRTVEDKLRRITPRASPGENYFLHFHPIIDLAGNEIPELFVFELEVKEGSDKPYRTQGGRLIDRSYSGIEHLN